MTWYQPERYWFNKDTGEMIFLFAVPLPPEEFDAINNPYKMWQVTLATGLTATEVGEHHFGSWDETIPEVHSGRCDGQPPS